MRVYIDFNRRNFPWCSWARSIQPTFRPVRPGKEDHLKRWTCFFETFPVGPNRSIEFRTEISGNFGWMDRTPYLECIQYIHTAFCWQTRRIILHLNARGFMIKVFSIPKRFRQFPCCGDSMDCRRCTNFAGRFCVDKCGQHSTKLITLDHRLLCLHVGPNIGFLFGVS